MSIRSIGSSIADYTILHYLAGKVKDNLVSSQVFSLELVRGELGDLGAGFHEEFMNP
jgi:hypothetical protein